MRYSREDVANIVLSMPVDMTFELDYEFARQCGEKRMKTVISSDWESADVDSQEV